MPQPRIDQEWKNYAAAPELGLQALHARYVTHQYERHSHDFYVIGTFDAGAATYALGRKSITAPAGSVIIINPGEPHDGKSIDSAGYVYSMVYIEPHVVAELADELEVQRASDLMFGDAVVHDPRVFGKVQALHRALFADTDALRRDGALLEALKHLILDHAGIAPDKPGARDWRISRVREFLHANYRETVSTLDLAAASGIGRSQLNALFRTEYGLPPHAYLTALRLGAARQLLLEGMEGAEVALAVGLSDQSHLIRRFRGSFGITPSQFVAAHRTNVQSSWSPTQ